MKKLRVDDIKNLDAHDPFELLVAVICFKCKDLKQPGQPCEKCRARREAAMDDKALKRKLFAKQLRQRLLKSDYKNAIRETPYERPAKNLKKLTVMLTVRELFYCYEKVGDEYFPVTFQNHRLQRLLEVVEVLLKEYIVGDIRYSIAMASRHMEKVAEIERLLCGGLSMTRPEEYRPKSSIAHAKAVNPRNPTGKGLNQHKNSKPKIAST